MGEGVSRARSAERAVRAHRGKVRAMNAAEGGLIVETELPLG